MSVIGPIGLSLQRLGPVVTDFWFPQFRKLIPGTNYPPAYAFHSDCRFDSLMLNGRNLMKTLLSFGFLFLLLLPHPVPAQNGTKGAIPSVLANLHYDADGRLFLQLDQTKIYEKNKKPRYTLTEVTGEITGTQTGLAFDFHNPGLSGTLYYGFIPYGDSKYPSPVYRSKSADIEQGKAKIDIIKRFSGKYDMIGWQESGHGTLGYRIVDSSGLLVYDGKVAFKGTGPFEVAPTIIEGPFVSQVSEHGAIISFKTNFTTATRVEVNGKVYTDSGVDHTFRIDGLAAGRRYEYRVVCGGQPQTYAFQTAPPAGSRQPFTFAYCSDSRSGSGSGERNSYGTNAYIMKKIMALSVYRKVAFCQFTGDLVDGYLTIADEQNLQYANWKRSVEPFWHYFPIYVGMGNHEVLVRRFVESTIKIKCRIDRFPYATESAEALFAANFVNPQNGPVSEDGADYDPVPDSQDFPSYKETVYYYTYDNVAMIVLNSDYWYTPSKGLLPTVGGNPHGFILDNQLQWLRKTVQRFEKDRSIDHIFVTFHTPMFPNGGHVDDDMWYRGDNRVRPYVAGKPHAKGIIERRDELLDILVNQSRKTVAVLTGDEHNYCRLLVTPETPIYPEGYAGKKLHLRRPFYQINNGAAGAPYYAQEQTPWSGQVSGFTTQNAVVFFHVNGKRVEVEVQNPDTLEEVDRFVLR